ncbi:MAG: DUF305 domain-containing protein [Thermomicrobiales bacterium]|nr:DUF305 domain-containing protein [Thermomicrobiales bacterium]MCO5218259.1 DUF305 domain-containing protein [Thermomicrobiales bacterium]MCO5224950.1 DUF305 domain-containing protein [Thermomicrobiales bacterium]MCO5227756.1 DUF305 domain-containing protein [Thermomicrobiales bacterium]
MNTISRRSLLAVAGISSLTAISTSARVNTSRFYSCGAAMGTPAVHIDSDIPFEQAYIDTTIPYHHSTLKLIEIARDDIEDERLLTVIEELETELPSELEELASLREELFGDAEPEAATHEMMLISMGGVESCTDQSHMDFMDQKWVKKTYGSRDDKEFSFVSMMVLLLEMAQHQHTVATQLAEYGEVVNFSTRIEELRTPQIKVMREVRGELMSAY